MAKTKQLEAVDLFAGWGGFTAGAHKADVNVIWAANHWPLAVEAHRRNHPDTVHVCQDLKQANWTELPWYDILLASPACQGHSQASQPKRRLYHDEDRATAWAVVDCVYANRPSALIVENVTDFRDKWELYPTWRHGLESMGYQLQELVVRASHHGVPQRRDRLFVVGIQGKQPRIVSEPTAEPAFEPCIRWNLGDWRPVRNAAEGARYRIRNAQKTWGSKCLVQHVSNHPGVPLDQPIRTITTKDQWIVVDGKNYRPLLVEELACGMGFDPDYGWPQTSRKNAIKGLGNAVCPPVATALIQQVTASL
jgi:DNA (cytosine-5)-methyltransferase 1